MNLPELGVGLTWLTGLESLVEANSPSIDVLEIAPQAFWRGESPAAPQGRIAGRRIPSARGRECGLRHSAGPAECVDQPAPWAAKCRRLCGSASARARLGGAPGGGVQPPHLLSGCTSRALARRFI